MNRFFEEERWNYYLIIVPMVLFFTLFTLWAAFYEVDEVVRGEGKVIPSGQTKILQHFEGGIIADILVEEGEQVLKNQPLYRLTNEFFRADKRSTEIELLVLNARSIRLHALIDEQKTLQYDSVYEQEIPEIIKNELRIFNEEKTNRERKIAIARDQLRQKELKLQELNVKFDSLSIELQVANDNMAIQDQLLRKKVISKNKYLGELAQKQKIVTQIQETRNRIPIVKEEIAELKKKVESTRSEIRSGYLEELFKVQLELETLQEKDKAYEDRDLRGEVVSPVNGIVNKLYFNTIGGIIKPGDNIAEITPIEDKLMIEAKIKTSDRAHIWAGQAVSIEITAYDFSKFGLLKGELVGISPDSTVDKSGFSYYLVKIQAEDFSFNTESPILPGMIAKVNILTGKKTIMEYILKPLKDISQNSLNEN